MQIPFSPTQLDFGCVQIGSKGPDINVDPSFGPPAISFNGGLSIKEAPSNATVSADISDSTVFQIRDITLMEWALVPVPSDELPPGHKGPIPKVKVLEVVEQSTGETPVQVQKGQYILVRVAYSAPIPPPDVVVLPARGTLKITSSAWDTISVPLFLSLGDLRVQRADDTVLEVSRGGFGAGAMNFTYTSGIGPGGRLFFRISSSQLHSGITLNSSGGDFQPFKDSVPFSIWCQAQPDAPTGNNTLLLQIVSDKPQRVFGFAVPIKIS